MLALEFLLLRKVIFRPLEYSLWGADKDPREYYSVTGGAISAIRRRNHHAFRSRRLTEHERDVRQLVRSLEPVY